MEYRTVSDYKSEVKVYKLTDPNKESDSRALETVRKHLINPNLLKKMMMAKIHESDIQEMTTEHIFRGIWKISVERKVEFNYKSKKDIFISDENLDKVKEIAINNSVFRVEQNKATIEAIEQGYDEFSESFLFEEPKANIDKYLDKYLKERADKPIFSKTEAKVKKWLKSEEVELDRIKESLGEKAVFEWLEDRVYARNYDDRNSKNPPS